jgi:hypothetical protein
MGDLTTDEIGILKSLIGHTRRYSETMLIFVEERDLAASLKRKGFVNISIDGRNKYIKFRKKLGTDQKKILTLLVLAS